MCVTRTMHVMWQPCYSRKKYKCINEYEGSWFTVVCCILLYVCLLSINTQFIRLCRQVQVHAHVHLSQPHFFTHTYIYIYTFIYTCMDVHVHVAVFVCLCLNTCTHVPFSSSLPLCFLFSVCLLSSLHPSLPSPPFLSSFRVGTEHVLWLVDFPGAFLKESERSQWSIVR